MDVDPSGTSIDHWHADHDRAGDAQRGVDLDEATSDQITGGPVVDEIECPECGRRPGRACLVAASSDLPLAGGDLAVAHPARYHAALRACGNECRECWTEPEGGVQVRLGGADELITVLWSDYQTSTGTVGDLCARLVRAAGTPAGWLPDIDAVYFRTGRSLTCVTMRFVRLGAARVGVEVTDALTAPAGIARGAFVVPDDVAYLLQRYDLASPDADVDPRLAWTTAS